MPFAIEFTRKEDCENYLEPDELCGRIVIGDDFPEYFGSLIGYWTKENYERQWRDGIERIVAGATTSCLITSISDPAHANFFRWWVLYREGNRVYFQEQMLFLDQLKVSFSVENPYASVRPRETVTEDGHTISEWQIDLKELEAFLEQYVSNNQQ